MWEQDLCCSCLICMLFVHPVDSSGFGCWCFFCSLSGIIRLFVHSLSWLSCRTRAPGALEVRLWEFAFYCFPCIQWIVCVSCFFVCSFYGFLIFMLSVHPFDSFSFSGHCLGTSFFVERWTENLLGCVSIFPSIFCPRRRL